MTGLLAVKLRRDLWTNRSRLLLMVVAITVSLIVFGAVLAAWSAVGRETRAAYAGTEPASATIVLDQPVDVAAAATLLAEVRDRPGVLNATARTQFTGAVEVDGQPRTSPLQVFVAAPDDPMRLARFDIDDGGSWPPAAGQVLVGRDGLALLEAKVGDTLTVRTPDGRPLPLRVAGTVYDPSLAPSPQEQAGHGYLSTTSLVAAGLPAGLDQIKIQVTDPAVPGAATRDRDRAATVAAEVGDWLRGDRGLAVAEIQVPQPYAHPHQWQADTLLLSLLVGGAAALLLSSILVATMLGTLFGQQIPQIGIMKAVGAGSGRIGALYLAMTLLVAAAATALAVVPAVLIGRLGATTFLGFLGVRPVEVGAAWWVYAILVAAGLGLPPLLALVPLVRTSRTTVRAALDHHGGADPATASRLLDRLGRLTGRNRGLLMALRNTVRRPARTVLAVVLLATAASVFVAGMSLSSSTSAIDEQRRAQRTWDVDVQLSAPVPAGEAVDAAAGAPGVASVQGWTRLPTAAAFPGRIPLTRTYPDQGHGRLFLTALPPRNPRPPAELVEGRWFDPDETGVVVLNQVARDTAVPGVRVGDTIELDLDGTPTPWRVVGLVEEREGGSGGAYTTPAALAAALNRPPLVNQLRIDTTAHDEPSRAAAAAAVEARLTAAGFEVQSAASISRADAVSAGHLGPVVTILIAIAVALGIVGAIGLAATMSANTIDRTREFGVLHAIGAPPTTVRRVVVTEAVLVALASCVAATVPTLVLTAALDAGLGTLFMGAPLPLRISALAVAIWVLLAVLGAILASDAPANRAGRITVREALAHT